MALQRARAMGRALAMASLLVATLATPAAVLADHPPAELGLDGISTTSATVSPTGLVTVTGELTCSEDLEGVGVSASVTQVVGRFRSIDGSGWMTADCLSGSGEFSVSFYAWGGKFAPGNARLDAYAEYGFCTEEECSFDSVSTGTQAIRLRR